MGNCSGHQGTGPGCRIGGGLKGPNAWDVSSMFETGRSDTEFSTLYGLQEKNLIRRAHGRHSQIPAGSTINFTMANLGWWAYVFGLLNVTLIPCIAVWDHVLPLVTWHWWNSCLNTQDKLLIGCVILWHVILIPWMGFSFFVGLYSIKWLSYAGLRFYQTLLYCYVTVVLVTCAVVWGKLTDGVEEQWPMIQQVTLGVDICVVLIGACFGTYLLLKVSAILHPLRDPRYRYPNDEADLQSLVRSAYSTGSQIRVKGSGHSVYGAIFTDEQNLSINVSLVNYTSVVHFQKERVNGKPPFIEVQAGMHLGKDPEDPQSTWENSLSGFLHKHGFALPDYGGITHQTVAGFISTGSAGGNLKTPLENHIIGFRIINGLGEIQEVSRDSPHQNERDLFFALGVSMGLLGVISTVTFSLEGSFCIEGSEITSGYYDNAAVDFFGTDNESDHKEEEQKPSLAEYFQKTDYARIFWWPQLQVQKLVVWGANRIENTPSPLKPYKEFENSFDQVLVSEFYRWCGTMNFPYTHLNAGIVNKMINTFTKEGTQNFSDYGYKGIPMDNGIKGRLIPTLFTELWFDLKDADKVVNILKEYFAGDNGFDRTGVFGWEVYSAAKSEFWLSPAQQDVFRLDVIKPALQDAHPQDSFYPEIWNLFLGKNAEFGDRAKINFRPHWGKFIPPDTCDWLPQMYPKWDQFMAIREKQDPRQIFVSYYWRHHLKIEPLSPAEILQDHHEHLT